MSCCLVLLLAGAARALDWHAPGWQRRAVVDIASKAGGVDVAAVRIYHGGDAAPDANDYRIFDEAARPVPYQVTWHHPRRDTLLSFRCASGQGTFAIYYGKPDAGRDPLRAIDQTEPGKGAPRPGPGADGWIPRAGLVLTTMRRPREADNPKSIEQLTDLISQSPGPDGAGYRARISDSFNPFGDSDYFISAYRGWINLPRAGNYGFCTASNEASFSFIDGQPLVHWPGRHTEQRGKYGEKNVVRQLAAGAHYIEYYHEEVLLYQVAFLGYRPPGAGRFDAIPEALYRQPHLAQVLRYEAAGAVPAVALHPSLLDSVWPEHRDAGQYTRYRFVADAGARGPQLDDWQINWDFGDGIAAAGATVEHVYLETGRYMVTMAARGPGEQRIEQHWPLDVFPIEHLEGAYKAGERTVYQPIVAGYDIAELPTPLLAEFARFQDEAASSAIAAVAARAVIDRSDAAADDLADMHWLIALASDKAGDPAAAALLTQHLQAALEHEADPAKKMHILTRLIRSFAVQRADPAAAEELYKQATGLSATQKLQGRFKAAFRQASIAIGDARLHANQHDQADNAYRLAESLADPPIPVQVRNAKIGAYHEAIVQHLSEKRFDTALTVARQWRDTFPSDQIRGEVLFWLGKIELLRKRPAEALAPLQLAVEVAPGAEFEAEARWLLAQTCRDLGDSARAAAELNALVKSGLSGPFRQKAIDALAKSGQ